jgi:hypothetical protein
MRYLATLTLLTALSLPTAASAQDFGVAQSAETINRGNFKLLANPVLVFGKDGGDNDGGVALGVGYGITDRVDVEGRFAFYDGISFYGGDLEFGFLKGPKYDVSATVGGHLTDTEGDSWGALDLTFQASRHMTPKLEVYGALDLAFESGSGDSYQTVHLVPGVEYALSDDFDLVAEFGVGLNDSSSHYLTGGIAYYFRK